MNTGRSACYDLVIKMNPEAHALTVGPSWWGLWELTESQGAKPSWWGHWERTESQGAKHING